MILFNDFLEDDEPKRAKRSPHIEAHVNGGWRRFRKQPNAGVCGDNVCSDPMEWRRRRFKLKAALLETNPQMEEETKPNPRN